MVKVRLILLGSVALLACAGGAHAAPTVGVYYYPWYGPDAGGHHYNHTLRVHTMPEAQMPVLGTYNSRDASVIGSHIDQSHIGNISMWSLSWWGPNSYEDVTIRDHIFEHPRASELEYTIHYETSGRLGSSSDPDYDRLESDFRHLAENVFDNPNYMRVDGRPVIVMYLSRVYFTSQPGWDALANVRSIMQNEYGYDPYIIGDHFFGGLQPGAEYLDAVTTFDVYGQTFGSRPTNLASVNRLEGIYNGVQDYVDSIGVDFVPGLAAGYNDTAVRDGNAPAPRYLLDEEFGPDTKGSVMSEMLDRVVLPHTDSDILDLLLVNSFNEWHEDTQIEPTIISPSTNTDDTLSGMGYTAGYQYEGYGNLYLDILREKTLPDIPGDFNRDGNVDNGDLEVWSTYYGTATGATLAQGDANQDGDVDGSDFLLWQREFGTTVFNAASYTTVPEPTSCAILGLALGWLCLGHRRQPQSNFPMTHRSCRRAS